MPLAYILPRSPAKTRARAIGDRQLRPDRKPASLQVEQEILPRLRTLAHVINCPTSSFLPSGVAPMMTSRHCAASSSRAWT